MIEHAVDLLRRTAVLHPDKPVMWVLSEVHTILRDLEAKAAGDE